MEDERKEERVADRREEDRWAVWEKRIRELFIVMVGIGGVVNELWFVEDPRIPVLVFLGSLIGVPFVLGADERRASKGSKVNDRAQ